MGSNLAVFECTAKLIFWVELCTEWLFLEATYTVHVYTYKCYKPKVSRCLCTRKEYLVRTLGCLTGKSSQQLHSSYIQYNEI